MNKLLPLAAALVVAGCADSTKVVEPTRNVPQPSFDLAKSEIRRHVLPGKAHASNDANSNGTKGRIQYHGGPLLTSATKVVAVYWSADRIFDGGPRPGSTGSGANDGSLVGHFLRNLGGSPYFNINTTYYDGTGTHVANVVNYTGFWANNQSPLVPNGTQSVSDPQILDMLSFGFQHGYLTYDPRTLYAVFTKDKVNLGGGFGTQYCAYHWFGTVTLAGGTTANILYAAMPDDYAYPSACSMFDVYLSPNNDPHADAVINTLAHETEETTTDMFGNAWFDGRGFENADKCAWTFGTVHTTSSGAPYNMTLAGKNFLVQRNWVNAGNGYCSMSH
jgi:hypothetical protein